jgi:hypothetical protein
MTSSERIPTPFLAAPPLALPLGSRCNLLAAEDVAIPFFLALTLESLGALLGLGLDGYPHAGRAQQVENDGRYRVLVNPGVAGLADHEKVLEVVPSTACPRLQVVDMGA